MQRRNKLRKEAQAVSHPRDRKVRQLQKKEKHVVKMEQRKQAQVDIRLRKAVGFLWFRVQCIALEFTATAVPAGIIPSLVQLYINRNLDELTELKGRRQPPTGRIREIQGLYDEEMAAFQSCGLEVPVLNSDEEVEVLTQIWDGLPETAAVIRTEMVKVGPLMSDAEFLNLASKLVPLQDVHCRAANTLPRRLHKELSTQRQKSVKSGPSVETIRLRDRQKHASKQQQRSKQERKAALDELRNGGEIL